MRANKGAGGEGERNGKEERERKKEGGRDGEYDRENETVARKSMEVWSMREDKRQEARG